jgi:phage major head subunit gpT-like protein
MILNAASLATLFTAYSAAFKDAFNRATPDWEKIATLIPSSSEQNLYAFLGQFPKMREWLGDRQYKNMAAHSYSIVNKQFESTVAVPRNKIMDDQYGVFTPMMQEMGYAAKMHPDEVVFGMAAAGASTLCYDGQFFFDTDHPVIEEGAATTKSNYDSTGGGALWMLLDTRRPLKPFIFQKREDYKFQAFNQPSDEHVFKRNEFLYGVDARVNAGFGLWQLAYGSLNDLDATNFDAYVTAMMQLKSDEDKPLGIRPNLLVCGPSRRAEARALLDTLLIGGGNTNPNYKEVEVLVTPYLT